MVGVQERAVCSFFTLEAGPDNEFPFIFLSLLCEYCLISVSHVASLFLCAL